MNTPRPARRYTGDVIDESNNSPMTYGQAEPQARSVTWEEFAEIIATDDNPYVFPRPRAIRRVAMNVRIHRLDSEYPFASYDYCKRNGYGEIGSSYASRTIWHFDSVGTVRVP